MLKLTLLILSLSMLIFSCGDTTNITNPDVNVASVEIVPASFTFTTIGENHQFKANAYDENGGEVSATFSWSSSDEDIAVIGSGGLAVAVGAGTAWIYVTAGEAVDTATVKVDPTVFWVAATSGDWEDPNNWSTGTVPEADDTVTIGLDGTYTVTLTSNVNVNYLYLGAASGTQTLVTGTHQLTTDRGQFSGGAELQVDGSFLIKDEFYWQDGVINGNGVVEIDPGAEVFAGGGSKLFLFATLKNEGHFALVSGVSVDINGGTFENSYGALLDFQSDANLSVFNGGAITNLGAIVKSAGTGEATLSSSSATFLSSGRLQVDMGILAVRNGVINGVMDIGSGAILRQSGTTSVGAGGQSRGDGDFEITGSITLGEQPADLVRLNNVILDSKSLLNGIVGPGDLRINDSFIWRSGLISGPGKVTIMDLATAIFEGSGTKWISDREFDIIGSLQSDSELDLTMLDGARMLIDTNNDWTHTGGGNIKKGSGDTPEIVVLKTFRKTGTGALVVGVDFTCPGTMFLDEGVLTVQGAFNLQQTGKIVGGAADTLEVNHLRLIVVDSPLAILAGTIEVDADGAAAFMSIQGPVSIQSTFNLLVDVSNIDPIPAERLSFDTGGVALNGTLYVAVNGFPPENTQYRVVSTIDGTGSFTEIKGAGVFNEVREDDRGVLLIR